MRPITGARKNAAPPTWMLARAVSVPTKAMFEPTERSMLPIRMTKVMPIATTH